MTSAPHRQLGSRALICAALLLVTPGSALAQDIRGLEVCTVEKQLERRTGCLQSNIEFLQQALARLTRETNEKLAATARDLAGAKAEIAALKSALTKLDGELAQLRSKVETGAKKLGEEPRQK